MPSLQWTSFANTITLLSIRHSQGFQKDFEFKDFTAAGKQPKRKQENNNTKPTATGWSHRSGAWTRSLHSHWRRSGESCTLLDNDADERGLQSRFKGRRRKPLSPMPVSANSLHLRTLRAIFPTPDSHLMLWLSHVILTANPLFYLPITRRLGMLIKLSAKAKRKK